MSKYFDLISFQCILAVSFEVPCNDSFYYYYYYHYYYLLTAIEFPYTSTDKTNDMPKGNDTKTQYK